MKYFLFMAILFFLGCAFPNYQIKGTYKDYQDADLLKKIASLVTNEDMEIYASDADIGMLRAKTLPRSSIGATCTFHWIIQIDNGNITAKAKCDCYSGKYHTVYYLGDNAKPDQYWYWNIRNGLARLCNNNIQIIQM